MRPVRSDVRAADLEDRSGWSFVRRRPWLSSDDLPGSCMACAGEQAMISGSVGTSGLPPHEVISEGITLAETRYVEVRYADGSTNSVEVPWDWASD